MDDNSKEKISDSQNCKSVSKTVNQIVLERANRTREELNLIATEMTLYVNKSGLNRRLYEDFTKILYKGLDCYYSYLSFELQYFPPRLGKKHSTIKEEALENQKSLLCKCCQAFEEMRVALLKYKEDTSGSIPQTPEEVIKEALRGKDSMKFYRQFFLGDTSYGQSLDGADLSLVHILARHCRGNKDLIFLTFRDSKFYEERPYRWEHGDYSDKTIDRALELYNKNKLNIGKLRKIFYTAMLKQFPNPRKKKISANLEQSEKQSFPIIPIQIKEPIES